MSKKEKKILTILENYQIRVILNGIKIRETYLILALNDYHVFFILLMQQVANLVYQNHRKSLAYGRNAVNLSQRHGYEQMFTSPRRQIIDNRAGLNQHKSADLKQNRVKKQVELPNIQKKPRLLSKLSRYQQILIQKYQKNNSSDKQQLQLPKINKHLQSRGTTTTGIQSHQTNIFQPPELLSVQQKNKQQEQQRDQLTQQLKILAEKMPSEIFKLINKYYYTKLNQQFHRMNQIISAKVQDPNYAYTKDVMRSILQMSEKLKSINMRKDIVRFLALVTLENVVLPYNFFSQFQLQRLDIAQDKFKLKRISEQQIKMVVGIFLGIKVFCCSMFTKPENMLFMNINGKIDTNTAVILRAYASFFYTAFKNFFKLIPIHEFNHISMLKKKGVKFYRLLKDDQRFFTEIEVLHAAQHRKILNNLYTWIHRITSQVLKTRAQLKEQRGQMQSQSS